MWPIVAHVLSFEEHLRGWSGHDVTELTQVAESLDAILRVVPIEMATTRREWSTRLPPLPRTRKIVDQMKVYIKMLSAEIEDSFRGICETEDDFVLVPQTSSYHVSRCRDMVDELLALSILFTNSLHPLMEHAPEYPLNAQISRASCYAPFTQTKNKIALMGLKTRMHETVPHAMYCTQKNCSFEMCEKEREIVQHFVTCTHASSMCPENGRCTVIFHFLSWWIECGRGSCVLCTALVRLRELRGKNMEAVGVRENMRRG